jgi:hypothetical protein
MQNTVNKLRAQIEQLRLNLNRLSRELAEVRVELVPVEIFASSPSPSTMKRDHSIVDCCDLGENCHAEANAPSEFSGSYLFKAFPNRERQVYRFASALEDTPLLKLRMRILHADF